LPQKQRHHINTDERIARAQIARAGDVSVRTRLIKGESTMLQYALIFLILGLIAGALGLTGIAAVAGKISWVLFVVALVLLVVHLVRGRVPPPA
jgi:uncharacterized membrane protein YtjA (UPF0391 family)